VIVVSACRVPLDGVPTVNPSPLSVVVLAAASPGVPLPLITRTFTEAGAAAVALS
jgi:hypothetical protein